jgi:hypothetical protein
MNPYDSVRKEVLYYNIFIEFGIPKKVVMLLKMCLNEAGIKDQTGRHHTEGV